MKINRNVVNITALITLILLLVSVQPSRVAANVNTWKAMASMPTARYALSVVATADGKVYAIGGVIAPNNSSAVLEEYDPQTNTWQNRQPMSAARIWFSAVATPNNKIYVFGGDNDSISLASVEEYDPQTNTWQTKTPMPITRRGSNAVLASNGKIYLFGGGANWGGSYPNTVVSEVDEYDPQMDTWKKLGDMPMPREGIAAALASNGKIYTFGGNIQGTNYAIVQEYDPLTDTWQSKGAYPYQLSAGAAAPAQNGKIYIAGGYYDRTRTEEYDPTTNTMQISGAMNTPRYFLGLTNAPNGKIYAVGGTDGNGQLASMEEFTLPSTSDSSISGHISDGSGIGISGVAISNGLGQSTISDQSGNYAFTNLITGTYTLTPVKIGYTFSPSTRLVTVGPDATGQDFTASSVTYSVSGQVVLSGDTTGLAGVLVSDSKGHTANTDATGNYAITGLPAGAYTLTPSKPGYTFDPPTRSGNLIADLTGQNFSALANENLVLKADSGFNNNRLKWEPARNPAISVYRVWRASPTVDSNYTELAAINGLDYSDSAGLTDGVNYCYKVDALSNSSIVASSTPQCVVSGQVNLWVPEMNGMKGNTITVPINIRNATGLSVASADIWLSFDASVLTCTDVTKTAMTVDFQWYANCTTPGKVVISTFSSPAKPIAGNGSLFWLTFTVQGNTGSSSPLTLLAVTPPTGGSSISTDPGDGVPVNVPLILTSSTFHVEDGGILGDVNNDKIVSGMDSYLALQISVGKVVPDWRQQYSADVNGDGVINSADVSMILYYAAYGKWPEVPTTASVQSLQKANTSSEVSLDTISGNPGTVITTTLRAQNLQNWAGGDFVITFDPRTVSGVTDVTVSGLASAANVAWYYNGNGILRISIASNAPLEGSGVLATIKLQLAHSPSVHNTPLVMAGAQFHDLYGRDFEFSALQGTINRTSGSMNSNYVTFMPAIKK